MSGDGVDPADERRPARGYSWAPFAPGHELSTTHGAYSPRRVDPLAQDLVDGVLALAAAEGSTVAYLADVTYRQALWAWARTEARVQLVAEWLLDRGGQEVDAEGEVLGAAKLLNRLEANALAQRQRLGLDPLSRARLGKDVASAQVDVAKLMAEEAEREGRPS